MLIKRINNDRPLLRIGKAIRLRIFELVKRDASNTDLTFGEFDLTVIENGNDAAHREILKRTMLYSNQVICIARKTNGFSKISTA